MRHEATYSNYGPCSNEGNTANKEQTAKETNKKNLQNSEFSNWYVCLFIVDVNWEDLQKSQICRSERVEKKISKKLDAVAEKEQRV